MERALSAAAEDDETGNSQNFILDTGANPSFVSQAKTPKSELTKPTKVWTLSGTFQTSTQTTLQINTKD